MSGEHKGYPYYLKCPDHTYIKSLFENVVNTDILSNRLGSYLIKMQSDTHVKNTLYFYFLERNAFFFLGEWDFWLSSELGIWKLSAWFWLKWVLFRYILRKGNGEMVKTNQATNQPTNQEQLYVEQQKLSSTAGGNAKW